MNLTAIAFLMLFVGLTIAAFNRPSWGVAVYFLTYYANPNYWWWGKAAGLDGQRWSLWGGIILLVAVLAYRRTNSRERPKGSRFVERSLVLIGVNATLVHFILSPNLAISSGPYILLLKFILLYFLIVHAIQSRKDLQIVLLSLSLGAGYIGYEATINDRGKFRKGRMEGIGAPGARGANQLASLMVTGLPVLGVLSLVGHTRWLRLLAVILSVFSLNVVLLCNSRGAFLALICAAIALLIAARGRTRTKAVIGVILGGIVTYMLLGDPKILDRFMTTFVGSEERDSSAASRILFWRVGLNVIADHPLGSGGNGYKMVHSKRYLPRALEETRARETGRSVHSGFLNEAVEWGVQGLLLRLLFLGGVIRCALHVIRFRYQLGDYNSVFLAVGLISGMAGFLITCLFGDYLDAEWGYWIAAILVGWASIYGPPVMPDTMDGISNNAVLPTRITDPREMLDQQPV